MRKRVRSERAKRKKLAHSHHQQTREINKRQIRRRRGTHQVQLSFPSVFCLRLAPKETLQFLTLVDQAFLDPDTADVRIDHASATTMGIEAALILISEFSRLTTYSPGVRLFGKFEGMDPKAYQMLDGIGYFRYYPGYRRQSLPADVGNYYIKHTTGTSSDAKASGQLIEAFKDSGYITDLQAKRLGRCIVECLDNVSHHAYPLHLNRCLRKRWWLVGYCDRSRGELFFAVVDRGVGIPETLQNRKRESDMEIFDLIKGRSDEELLVSAFLTNFSRTKKQYRGLGLPGLKRILDDAGRGELFVRSAKSTCTLLPGRLPSASRCEERFTGTLLAWRLQIQVSQS